MTNKVDVRELAVNTVAGVMEQNCYSHLSIRKTLDSNLHLSKSKRAFYTKLCEGTIEQAIHLDYIINQYSKIETERMKPFIRNLLRVSVYQIKFMDSVPDSAVCNEAVKLTARRGFYNLKGFINGVLRNVARNIDNINYPDREKDIYGYLEIKYSTPGWLVKKYVSDYGVNTAERILAGYFDNKNITTVRVNTSKISVDEVKTSLRSENICVQSSQYYKNALDISGYDNINKITAFRKGYISVQNISSILAGAAAKPKEHNYIIDVCASPGGKSIHVGDLMKGTGFVEARDITDYKVSLIQENIDRTGMTNVHAVKYDATVSDENLLKKADIVIADLPCSGLGVFGNKSDIKYKINERQIKDLVKLQRKILSVVNKYVKPGGYLIYSTCTINPDENIKNALWFSENFSFEFQSIADSVPEELDNQTIKKGYVQILPGIHKADGFFIAKFKRI